VSVSIYFLSERQNTQLQNVTIVVVINEINLFMLFRHEVGNGGYDALLSVGEKKNG
jgi:hypothetical protein